MVRFQAPTPYINPSILLSAATGISWSSIPTRQASPEQQLAEQYNICARATAFADTAANQVLRADIVTEQLRGPGSARFQIDNNGNANLIMSRAPILAVVSARAASMPAPLQWQAVPVNAFVVDIPPLGMYGTSTPSDAAEFGQQLLLSAGYVSWRAGRGSQILQVQYANGWPHCSLTADTAAGSATVAVDDCTGWAPPAGTTQGAAGIFYDPAGGQETCTVTDSSVTSGPGTLTISPATSFRHQAGVIYSALPSQIQWSCILFAISQALTRGATATTVQTITPSGARTSDGADELMRQAYELIDPYRRVR